MINMAIVYLQYVLYSQSPSFSRAVLIIRDRVYPPGTAQASPVIHWSKLPVPAGADPTCSSQGVLRFELRKHTCAKGLRFILKFNSDNVRNFSFVIGDSTQNDGWGKFSSKYPRHICRWLVRVAIALLLLLLFVIIIYFILYILLLNGGRGGSLHQGWWTEELAKAVVERRDAWKMIEGFRDRGEQPSTGLRQLCGQKNKAARRAMDRARRSMEEELYRKLDKYGGKKMIFKMARDRTEDLRDVKRCAVIKDNNGRLITESKEVLRIWAANVKELLDGKGAASYLELPSSVRREVEVKDIGQEEMETAMHKMKKARRPGQTKCG